MLERIKRMIQSKFNPVTTEIVMEPIRRPQIVMIHGANATERSFAYIVNQLPDCNCIMLNYESADGFYYNLERIVQHVKALGPVFIVAHSLGGVYALHMLQHVNVNSVISVSSPFGGSATADWARYMMPNYQLFRDIGTRSQPILQCKEIEITVPWTQIVTTRGTVPWHKGDNDGVVTVNSMTGRNDMEYVYVNENHYEILGSDIVVNLIKDKYLASKL
jgi:pimeloyl-ACP methyl ester carboxylesterase